LLGPVVRRFDAGNATFAANGRIPVAEGAGHLRLQVGTHARIVRLRVAHLLTDGQPRGTDCRFDDEAKSEAADRLEKWDSPVAHRQRGCSISRGDADERNERSLALIVAVQQPGECRKVRDRDAAIAICIGAGAAHDRAAIDVSRLIAVAIR
jgi:hypothetical protein